MAELRGHWTNKSIDDFLFRIGFDFVGQLENWMESENIPRSTLAETLGVSKGRVSQVLNDPGNLTLRKVVEYARALNRKVAIVAYDDSDPENKNGPINGQVFARCWIERGHPVDMFDFEAMPTAATETTYSVPLAPHSHGSASLQTSPYALPAFQPVTILNEAISSGERSVRIHMGNH